MVISSAYPLALVVRVLVPYKEHWHLVVIIGQNGKYVVMLQAWLVEKLTES